MNTLASLFLLETFPKDDPVAFTFFSGYMAMFAATIFFWLSIPMVSDKWKTSLIVSGLVTFIAGVHYYYMRDTYMATGESPTAYRYIDWTLTVPLLMVEFYLLLKPAGAKAGLLTKLVVASLWMLIAGYIGEAFYADNGPLNILWGIISTLGYLYIVYEIYAGEGKKLAANSNKFIKSAQSKITWFVIAGWAIYPIGYMLLDGNLLSGLAGVLPIDLVYNIGDAVNKIGFGLVTYSAAISMTKLEKEQGITDNELLGKKKTTVAG
ncbi:bacteriorhodopsin-like [Catalinimonas sp. 4WD22]|uniref:bacteriorhodopsin-like n=1 Tax=Catalinimonas locisalis TaxID=3133978 RepID=UPI0031016676